MFVQNDNVVVTSRKGEAQKTLKGDHDFKAPAGG
jgi:hypothetical protein